MPRCRRRRGRGSWTCPLQGRQHAARRRGRERGEVGSWRGTPETDETQRPPWRRRRFGAKDLLAHRDAVEVETPGGRRGAGRCSPGGARQAGERTESPPALLADDEASESQQRPPPGPQRRSSRERKGGWPRRSRSPPPSFPHRSARRSGNVASSPRSELPALATAAESRYRHEGGRSIRPLAASSRSSLGLAGRRRPSTSGQGRGRDRRWPGRSLQSSPADRARRGERSRSVTTRERAMRC